jgi:hypothetical protein
MMQDHPEQLSQIKNYGFGILGFSTTLADVTDIFQAIGVIAGALLVCRQLYRDFKKK